LHASAGSWSTAQLVEFLAQLAEETDEHAAKRAAVERVLEALDADVGILVGDGDRVHTVVGLGPDTEPVADLIAVARDGVELIDLPGIGKCRTTVLALEDTDTSARLVVARRGAEEFDSDELLLLRGMAWVLHLALRPLRTLAKLHERQGVLDRVSTIQRAIADRAPLPEVLDTVTESVLGLFGNELAVLYLADADRLVIASVSCSVAEDGPISLQSHYPSIGQLAYTLGQPVRTNDYASASYAVPQLVERGARAAMAAPVRENGALVGSLVVVSFQPEAEFTEAHERTLLTFADQISIALSDAKTLATAQQAVRDPVTGLANRVLFLQRLELALSRARSDSPVHVLFLDLDRFKFVNDTLGHAVGDELLREVGRRLRECLRSEDCLARFGGDEYAVLIENTSFETVNLLAERLLSVLQAPYPAGAEEVMVGGSIGMATGHRGCDAGDVLRDADTAMYRAKHAGGNRLVVFEHSMHTSLLQRVSLEADLHRAIDSEELFALFQPIACVETAEVYSAEALLRWQHPTRGVVSPSEFVPLAEETGLIIAIGRRMLTSACAQAAAWPSGRDGRPAPSVSVNLSARQLHDPDLVVDIRSAVSAAGIAPERLILEITESTLMSDTAFVQERLQQIREIGVRLAIDDFGTGYSSLSYLRMFPVNILKIDRSFLDGSSSGRQGDAFLRTIMRLTETLSMTAIAEGVETVEQLQTLRDIGCPLGQGYLFGRPLTATEFHQALTRP
jgi:diguanylate cyclase (GGDEF)-like protein